MYLYGDTKNKLNKTKEETHLAYEQSKYMRNFYNYRIMYRIYKNLFIQYFKNYRSSVKNWSEEYENMLTSSVVMEKNFNKLKYHMAGNILGELVCYKYFTIFDTEKSLVEKKKYKNTPKKIEYKLTELHYRFKVCKKILKFDTMTLLIRAGDLKIRKQLDENHTKIIDYVLKNCHMKKGIRENNSNLFIMNPNYNKANKNIYVMDCLLIGKQIYGEI